MSFASRSIRTAAFAKKSFSTLAPKAVIGQNILRLKEISAASDEASLSKIASSPLPAFDTKNIPADLEHLRAYFELDNVAKSEPYIPDPTAWQNKGFWDFAAEEATRAETWPFLMGFFIVNLGIVALVKSQTEEQKKKSRYLQMLETITLNKVLCSDCKTHDNHGHGHGDHGHGAHH